MNSFIGWIGGKKALRDEIISRFPDDISRYIEVFGGAGWVLFGKGQKTGQLEVFNDFDGNLINLYRCIKHHAAELQREFDWLLSSREIFKDFMRALNISGLTDIQRAARYYYIIKYSFGNNRTTYRTGAKSAQRVAKQLLEVKDRLDKVVIENKDFQSLIKVYDRPGALFYLDPPYHGTEHYYSAPFSVSDHERLRDVLKVIKGRFLLSYNDDGFIRDLYKDFKIEPVRRTNNLSTKSKDYSELLISNY